MEVLILHVALPVQNIHDSRFLPSLCAFGGFAGTEANVIDVMRQMLVWRKGDLCRTTNLWSYVIPAEDSEKYICGLQISLCHHEVSTCHMERFLCSVA